MGPWACWQNPSVLETPSNLRLHVGRLCFHGLVAFMTGRFHYRYPCLLLLNNSCQVVKQFCLQTTDHESDEQLWIQAPGEYLSSGAWPMCAPLYCFSLYVAICHFFVSSFLMVFFMFQHFLTDESSLQI